ncbi:MAG: hypothetical protein ACT6U0_11645 [Shinella sp.]|uniref:hypothetical protein n=1 Tax=Shinella sp. TaxID=1870904 RepID=UPI004036D400
MALTPYVLPVVTGGDGKKRARKDQHEAAINGAISELKTVVDGKVNNEIGSGACARPIFRWYRTGRLPRCDRRTGSGVG